MKISIITPTHNRLKFLKENIRSVQLSKIEPLKINYEHIICDVGSTDGTSLWLKQIASRDHHIYLIHHPTKVPPGQARNLAIKQATGDYIIPLDDDDLILQRTLYNFASLAKKYPAAKWYVSDFLRIDEKGHYSAGQDYYSWDFISSSNMLTAIFNGEHFIQGNVMFDRKLFYRAGAYNEITLVGEDIDLYIRFILKSGLPSRSCFISHLHRSHKSNSSQGVTLSQHKKYMLSLLKKYQNEPLVCALIKKNKMKV